MLANQVAIQKRYWSAAHFKKFGDENAGNRRFTGAGEASEKDCQALFVPWWKTAPQFLYDLVIGKPCMNFASFILSLTQFFAIALQHVYLLDIFKLTINIIFIVYHA